MVSAQGVPNTFTYTVDSNAEFKVDSKTPRGKIIPCSNILRADFTSSVSNEDK